MVTIRVSDPTKFIYWPDCQPCLTCEHGCANFSTVQPSALCSIEFYPDFSNDNGCSKFQEVQDNHEEE